MLVVDVNALSAVNFLNFRDDIFLNGVFALDAEYILRVGRTGSQFLSLFHGVALFDFKTCAVGDKNLALFACFGVRDCRINSVLYLAERDCTRNFRKYRHNFRMTYFEKFLNSGKTLSDVTAAARNTAGVERSHRQLRTGFAYRLCRDDSDGFADVYGLGGCKVFTVASCADTVFAAAAENGTNLNSCNARRGNSLRVRFGHRSFAVFCNYNFACGRVNYVVNGESAEKSCFKRLDLFVSLADFGNPNARRRAAVVVSDDNVLRNIDKSSCQVTGVCGTERRVRLTFTRTSRRDEVFKNGKTFTEVRSDGNFYRFTGGICHKSAHTAKLTDLVDGAAGAGNRHHVDGVLFAQVLLQLLRNRRGRAVPNGNYLTVFFLVGNHASLVKFLDFRNFLLGFCNNALLLGRNYHVRNGNGYCRLGGVFVTLCLDRVKHFGGSCYAVNTD